MISVLGAIGNVTYYYPDAKMTRYEVADLIMHLKRVDPEMKVNISTLGTSLTSRYAARNMPGDVHSARSQFVPFKW